MSLVLKDRVKETTSTTGTGVLDLDGAEAGFEGFLSSVGDGNTCYYAVVDADNIGWEVGVGTVTDSGTVMLSRDTVLESSNSGQAISLTSGEHTVFLTYPADKSVYRNTNDQIVTTASGIVFSDSSIQTTAASGYTAGTGISLVGNEFNIDSSVIQSGDNISALVNDTGYLTTPSGSSVDNALARYDGTTGKLVQDSLVTVSDSGQIRSDMSDVPDVDADWFIGEHNNTEGLKLGFKFQGFNHYWSSIRTLGNNNNAGKRGRSLELDCDSRQDTLVNLDLNSVCMINAHNNQAALLNSNLFGVYNNEDETFVVTAQGAIKVLDQSANPGSPGAGKYYIWVSDGTADGFDGDLMLKQDDNSVWNLLKHGAGEASFLGMDGGAYPNTSTAIYSVVVGGRENDAVAEASFVGGGRLNVVNTTNSAIVGGELNSASGDGSFIGGGHSNITTGIDSCVPGGLSNQANQDYSTALGREAVTRNKGEITQSAGAFSTAGDSQIRRLHLRRQTTNATLTSLTDDNAVDSVGSWNCATKTLQSYEVVVIGHKDDDSEFAKYTFDGLIRRASGSPPVSLDSNKTVNYESDAAWDCDIAVGSGGIKINVTGVAATNINWTAKVVLTESTVP